MDTESKEFKKKIEAVRSIGNKDLVEKIKERSKSNLQGAVIGGVIGVVGAVALRKKWMIGGLVGAIAGRLLLGKWN